MVGTRVVRIKGEATGVERKVRSFEIHDVIAPPVSEKDVYVHISSLVFHHSLMGLALSSLMLMGE